METKRLTVFIFLTINILLVIPHTKQATLCYKEKFKALDAIAGDIAKITTNLTNFYNLKIQNLPAQYRNGNCIPPVVLPSFFIIIREMNVETFVNLLIKLSDEHKKSQRLLIPYSTELLTFQTKILFNKNIVYAYCGKDTSVLPSLLKYSGNVVHSLSPSCPPVADVIIAEEIKEVQSLHNTIPFFQGALKAIQQVNENVLVGRKILSILLTLNSNQIIRDLDQLRKGVELLLIKPPVQSKCSRTLANYQSVNTKIDMYMMQNDYPRAFTMINGVLSWFQNYFKHALSVLNEYYMFKTKLKTKMVIHGGAKTFRLFNRRYRRGADDDLRLFLLRITYTIKSVIKKVNVEMRHFGIIVNPPTFDAKALFETCSINNKPMKEFYWRIRVYEEVSMLLGTQAIYNFQKISI